MMTRWIAALAACLLTGATAASAEIGVSPRLAVPLGDFADATGVGFGLAVTKDHEIKQKPVTLGLVFLQFGEEELGTDLTSSASVLGAFVGYRHDLEKQNVYLKIDAGLYNVTAEIEALSASVDDSDLEVKLHPGVGYDMGRYAVEADVDLAFDWILVNFIYYFGD